jgi:hypothetical protein
MTNPSGSNTAEILTGPMPESKLSVHSVSIPCALQLLCMPCLSTFPTFHSPNNIKGLNKSWSSWLCDILKLPAYFQSTCNSLRSSTAIQNTCQIIARHMYVYVCVCCMCYNVNIYVSMYYNNVINISWISFKIFICLILIMCQYVYMIIIVFGTERAFSNLILVLELSPQLQSVRHCTYPLTYWVLLQWRKQPRCCKQQFHAYL